MSYKVYGKLAFVCLVDCITILIGFIVSFPATYNNNFYNKSSATIRCHRMKKDNWFISNVTRRWSFEIYETIRSNRRPLCEKKMNCLMLLCYLEYSMQRISKIISLKINQIISGFNNLICCTIIFYLRIDALPLPQRSF